MKKLSQSYTWQLLREHAHAMPLNASNGLVSAGPITLDFSRQHVNHKTHELLFMLANESKLLEKIKALMAGDSVNLSEGRPALHTALRAPLLAPIIIDGKNILEDIHFVHDDMRNMVKKIRDGAWLGHSGKPIKDIVNIGIGGSDLGPRFCLNAFVDECHSALNYHFISDADPHTFRRATAKLNPDTTLFIISSKSFTTEETLYNAHKAKAWLGDAAFIKNHCIAVTANPEKATAFGISHVLPIWQWVGGRYSFCSAINLITAIAIGWDAFEEILAGARAMDEHFLTADFSKNLPVLMGLLGIWNNNFLNIHNLLLLVYAEQLEKFVPYVQQLDMESNGKSIDNEGRRVDYATGPLVWGGMGNQVQHSYFQLLCQGTHKVAIDFITLETFKDEMINASCEAKVNVLSKGTEPGLRPEGAILGKIPLTRIHLKDCSPYTIGALVALYEHKIFTQSVIWNINPFDQQGVESAKVMFRSYESSWKTD